MAGLTLATLMAGLMLIIMGLLRFGDLIKFIPKNITIGFTLGIAVGIEMCIRDRLYRFPENSLLNLSRKYVFE